MKIHAFIHIGPPIFFLPFYNADPKAYFPVMFVAPLHENQGRVHGLMECTGSLVFTLERNYIVIKDFQIC